MHHPTDHTTAFVTPVVEHWLEREIAQWVHPMKDRSDDPPHHGRTLFPEAKGPTKCNLLGGGGGGGRGRGALPWVNTTEQRPLMKNWGGLLYRARRKQLNTGGGGG